MLTEFGWPAGPNGFTETNQFTGQHCGIASEANQRVVLEGTIARLNQLGDERGYGGGADDRDGRRHRFGRGDSDPIGELVQHDAGADGNITFGGGGASRTVTVMPAANQSGTRRSRWR